MHRKILSLILVFLVCASLVACSKNKEEDTKKVQEGDKKIAVQADEFVYYADELQRELDLMIENFEMLGATLTSEERANAAQEVIDEYAIRALTKAQLKKLKKDKLDDNQLYKLRSDAQKRYEEYWQQFRDSDSEGELTDKEITKYLEDNGITVDYVYETVLMEYQMQLLMDHYNIKINISEKDIDDFYEENYVKPCRERYENNIPLFEEEVIYGEGNSTYTPAGFKLMHQIVIPIPDNIKAELTQIENQAEEATNKAQEAYNKIAQLAIDGKDTKKQTEIYNQAIADIDRLDTEYSKLWEKVLMETDEECDEIYARLKMGETFEDLMKYFNPNDEIIYHPQSAAWSDELKEGAATLKKKGDISQPTLCSDGVHILRYYDDIPSGAAKLEDEEDRERVRQALTMQKTTESLKSLTDPWAKSFNLKTDISVLKY